MDPTTYIQKSLRYFLVLISTALVAFSGSLQAQPNSLQPLTITVKDNQGKVLPGIVVYATWLEGKTTNKMKHSAIDIRQKDKGFNPYLSVVQSNSTVTFSNLDDITHHIYSVTGIERFSYSLQAGKITPPLSIEQAGLIAMGCNIHDWMSGYLLVVNTPYYALTNQHGKIELNIQQQGKFQVTAWHPQFNEKLNIQVSLPIQTDLVLNLTEKMAKIPSQKSSDDFDFLEGY